jgi:putative integral membrane protein (TIGR02587 family)
VNVADELREQGRGMAGALLVLGLSFAYTVETWWLAVEVRPLRLLAFVLAGLALVVPVTRSVGFRDRDEEARSPVWVESAEVVFQAFLVGFATLALLGVLAPQDPAGVIVRSGLVHAVPLAFGAALANEFLSGEQDEIPEADFPRSLGVFAMGAVFLAAPIAPTEEVAVLAARVGWGQIGAILVASLLVTYLVLFELEFRGQEGRATGMSWPRRLGQTCMLYAVGLAVAAVMLVAIGDVDSVPFATAVRRTVVLGFPAAIGASAARVVVA